MARIDVSGIEGDQRSSADIQRELEAREAEQKTKLAEIRERIVKDGDSTGDVLKDLVIVRTHRLDSETVELYRDLSARVAAHVGEPVLVVGHFERQTSFPGPSARHKPKGKVVVQRGLGVLASEELVLNPAEGSWAFPTKKYAVLGLGGGLSSTETVRESRGSLQTGACGDGMRGLFAGDSPYEEVVGQQLELRYDSWWIGETTNEPIPLELEVFVGQAEIDTYLERDLDVLFDVQRNTRAYNELARALKLKEHRVLSEDEFAEVYIARRAERDAAKS